MSNNPDKINVLNNTAQPIIETPKSQERINVQNIPPKSIGQRELQDNVIIRKLTTAQRDVITNLTAGIVIYNSTTNKLNFYNGSDWEVVTSA